MASAPSSLSICLLPWHPRNSSGTLKPSGIRGSSMAWQGPWTLLWHTAMSTQRDESLSHGDVNWFDPPLPHSLWGLAESSEGPHGCLLRENVTSPSQPCPLRGDSRRGDLGEGIFPGRLSKELLCIELEGCLTPTFSEPPTLPNHKQKTSRRQTHVHPSARHPPSGAFSQASQICL